MFPRRALLIAAAVLGAAGCGQSYVAMRPTEPVTAAGRGVSAGVGRVFLTDGFRSDGLDDDARLVVELNVRNDGVAPLRVSPGSFSCLMELDARRPEQTRALLPVGGGEGPFPGEPPDEGSVLGGVTIPRGEERTLWAIFEGYRFEGSDRPRRIIMKVPIEGGELQLVLADPARGGLRWEVPAERGAFVIGVRGGSLYGGLRGTTSATEATYTWRAGPLRLDAGLLSTIFVQTHGPLQSETSVFTGSGPTVHVAAPLFTWGPAPSRRQLGLYAGGAVSLLIEVPKRMPDENSLLRTYGLFQAEGGIELAGGQLNLAATPFPISVSDRQLPRWGLRLGYLQTWAGGATSSGYTTALRFIW